VNERDWLPHYAIGATAVKTFRLDRVFAG